jgi:exonuclease 3'-5' domain-containing protein 1
MASSFIHSKDSITKLINSLHNLPTNPPSLYFDLEGTKLSRNGSVSLLQLFVSPPNHVYLIDIHILGTTAFTTAGTNGQTTLKTILESTSIPKVCFDVRNDADALYAHFHIALQCIHDIQLMENASRKPGASKQWLNSLTRCIETDGPLTTRQKQTYIAIKDKAKEKLDPSKGGSPRVFEARPLDTDIKANCEQDVRLLAPLWKVYNDRLAPDWKRKAEQEARCRVQGSQDAGYGSQSSGQRARGPWQGDVLSGRALEEHNERVLEEWMEGQPEDDFYDPSEDPYDPFDDEPTAQDYEDWTGRRSPC